MPHSLKILLLLGLLASALANAGTADVGGGTGIVCRDSKNQVKSVELLDLVEGVHRHHYVIPENSVDAQEQAERALARLQFGYQNHTFATASPASYLRHVQKIATDVPAGFQLGAPLDLGKEQSVYVREGCKLELIGQREKAGTRVQLSLVPPFFSKLTPTHEAGFWVHEAIYSFYQSYFRTRITDEEGTAKIRKLTAALLASNTKLEEIVAASRFLFVLDKGMVYLADRRSGAEVEIYGREDEFDAEHDKLVPGDEQKFYCVKSGSKSRYVAGTEGKPKLVLEAGCESQLAVDGLKARLFVNGKEVHELQGSAKLELIFLKDKADYKELRGQSKYPFSEGASQMNRNTK